MADTTINETITAVPGIRVGHYTHPHGDTGCTVIMGGDAGLTASGLVLGGGPASREYALLDPARTMDRIDALLLTGGSALGLAAADGVMGWLLEQGRGFETVGGRVPIVPTAAIYDLMVASGGNRPDAAAGRAAAAAASAAPVEEGQVGVGAGATAGAYLGFDKAVRTGVGSSVVKLETAGGTVSVGALAVANPAGDVYRAARRCIAGGAGFAARRDRRPAPGHDRQAEHHPGGRGHRCGHRQGRGGRSGSECPRRARQGHPAVTHAV